MARQRPKGPAGNPGQIDPGDVVTGKRKASLDKGPETIPIAGWLGLALVLAALVGLTQLAERSQRNVKPRAVTPLAALKVTDLPQFAGEHKEDLFWGTYRPNLYLGIRARTPRSLVAGLMWFGPKGDQFSLRHTCEQGDGLQEYGWLRHDGATFGRQEMLDGGYFIETSFLKSSRKEGSAGYGGDWAVRISGRANPDGMREDGPLPAALYHQLSLFFYIMDESGQALDVRPEHEEDDQENQPLKVFAAGSTAETGPWSLYIKDAQLGGHESFVGVEAQQAHNLSKVVMEHLQAQMSAKQRVQLSGEVEEGANVAIYHLTATLPVDLDIAFVTGADEIKSLERAESLTGSELTAKLKAKEAAFDQRFEKTFRLSKKEGITKEMVEVSKAALSNMLGGMGYFYGHSRIAIPPGKSRRKKTEQPWWDSWEAPLFTATPSRSFFPRGFLWDEGFHQLLISKWDQRLSLDVMAHWLDLMNMDGWIPREQILGEEALSKVPEEFVLQHTTNANPPTLFLALQELAERVAADKDTGAIAAEEKAFLERSYHRLKAWFRWYNTTQIGKVAGSYYWHGRDPNARRELNPKSLSSGLDDYPRASHPDDTERHLDLRCWMALAASSMATIARVLGHQDQVYAETAEWLSDPEQLYKLHLDETSGNFYDYGTHTEEVALEWVDRKDPATGVVISRELLRSTLRAPEPGRFVPHYGYVSLFPLLMRLLPEESEVLGQQLQKLRDEKLLWTSYGLRSLATTSSLYMKRNTEHDPPYWRGPVWINLNYMALSALHHYRKGGGPHSRQAGKIYAELRTNVIRNVVRRYEESGYLWEQYDNAAEGVGKGSHPFTGWTALLVLIMAEVY